MANEVEASLSPGLALAYVLKSQTGLWYNTGTPAFEAYNSANVGNYGIAFVTSGPSTTYLGTIPNGIPAQLLTVEVYARAGSTLASSDLVNPSVANGTIPWTGTAVAPPVVPSASGQVTLSPAGLDSIVVESGVNARQALSPILAACAGVLSGAGTSTISIYAGANPSTQRISSTVDGSGNRTNVNLTIPA